MQSNKILIIDIETTGFMPEGKIVEIGAVSLDLTDGSIVTVFDELCKPEGIKTGEVMNSWIVQNKFIDPIKIKNARPLKAVVADFQAEIDSQNWVGSTAYNRAFDFHFLEREGVKLPNPLPCPMLLSTNECKIPSPRGIGFKWPKVEEAWMNLIGTDYIEKHRGADDASHEAQIVWKLIQLDIFKF